MSSDPEARNEFGPYTPGFITIPYNNIDALEKELKNPNVAGFLVEPIQGEAGVFVPDEGYLKKAYDLCRKNNVLFIIPVTGKGPRQFSRATHMSGTWNMLMK